VGASEVATASTNFGLEACAGASAGGLAADFGLAVDFGLAADFGLAPDFGGRPRGRLVTDSSLVFRCSKVRGRRVSASLTFFFDTETSLVFRFSKLRGPGDASASASFFGGTASSVSLSFRFGTRPAGVTGEDTPFGIAAGQGRSAAAESQLSYTACGGYDGESD